MDLLTDTTTEKGPFMPVKPIPEGYRSVTPYLTVTGAEAAIEFYKSAFGAMEVMRMPGPPGLIAHAELKIGDSMVMLSDEMPGSDMRSPKSIGGTTCGVFLYLEDVDATFAKAIAEGAQAVMPPTDMFWGDRFGKLQDPFGHSWSMATHKEDLTPEEMEKRAQAPKA